MKLAELESLPSFALLGPGFAGVWLVARGLEESAAGSLAFAAFEDRAVRRFAGRFEPAEVELPHPWPGPAPALRAVGHAAAVARIRSAIEAGDVYQVCLTVRAHLPPCSGEELLGRMCRRGVPRFAAWVRLPGGPELVSASPELLLEARGATVRSEPMKGTARPGGDSALEASEKDRAELAMITDLVRDDLARVCKPRSVRVPCERRLIDLGYAVQAVSDVEGELPGDLGPLDALAALHPGGSVTGAPRPAALAMIRELEEGPRGPYCGTLGLMGEEGATFALLIRTATRSADGWTYGVGGGIVHDSDPVAEAAELEVKLGAVR